MVRSGLIHMIREKADEGKSAYAIAKETGLAENTVKKYIRERGTPTHHGLSGRHKGSKLDPYKPQLDRFISQGIFNCNVLLERLHSLGYEGGITILKDYVKKFRPCRKGKAVERYETPPGNQAQMDWGILHYVDEAGKIHKVPAFVMIMGHSRAKYVECTKRCDFYSLVRCILNAFEYFGGVPQTVLTDRMKTVVLGVQGGEAVFHSGFSEFAADMGFVPKLCRVRRPQTKGKVERLVGYVKSNFLPGRTFSDLEDLNRQALAWCRQADSKVHGTTGEIPLKTLAREPLQSLPPGSVLNRYRWEIRKVTRDGYVSYDGVQYPLPWEYSNREVRVRVLNGQFEVYEGEVRIAQLPFESVSGRVVFLKGHYVGLAEKQGVPFPLPHAAKTTNLTVETRDLSIYDELAGVAANG